MPSPYVPKVTILLKDYDKMKEDLNIANGCLRDVLSEKFILKEDIKEYRKTIIQLTILEVPLAKYQEGQTVNLKDFFYSYGWDIIKKFGITDDEIMDYIREVKKGGKK